MKKTAVEHLFDNLVKVKYVPFEEQANAILKAFEQAKQMEKEQMEDSFDVGHINAFDDYHKMQKGEAFTTITFEEYYNETYKNTDK